jgi:hypothetical protein
MAAGLVVAQAPAATAADSKTDLGVTRFSGRSDVAVGDGKVFVSVGDRVIAADPQGSVTGAVTDLPGVTELALAADGAHLYAAVRGANQVAEIDTKSLAVTRRIDLTAYPCPSSLSLSDGRLYVGYGCSAGNSGAVSLDVSAAEPEYTQVMTGLYSSPLVVAAGRTLVVGDTNLTYGNLNIYDVSGATVTSRGVIVGSTYRTPNLQDLALTADGATLFTAFGFPYRFDSWDTATATHVRSYGEQSPSPGYSHAVAVSPDGAHVVGGRSSGTPVAMFDVATGEETFAYRNLADEVLPGALAISGTTVFAVLRDGSSRLYLARLPDVTLAASSLNLTVPATTTVLEPLTLTGRLTLAGGSAPGAQPLTVTRQRSDGTVATLPAVTTAEDGTFTVTDTPQAVEALRYDVTWDGNSTFRWSRAWAWTTVVKRGSSLTVTPPSTAATALEPLTLTGRLTLAGGSAPGAQPLTVSRFLPGGANTPLTEVMTAEDGTFSVTDTPPVGGVLYYQVHWDGNALYEPSQNGSNLLVAKRATTLTVSGPGKAVADSTIEFSGRLDGDGRLPSPNAVLTVHRTIVDRNGTITRLLRNVTVSDDGSFSFTDTPSERGEYTYSVKWAGDKTFSAAESAHVVAVRGRLD